MSAFLCPCCNRPMPGPVPVDFLSEIPMPPLQLRILSILAARYPRAVTADSIAFQLYQADPNGGPDGPRTVIRANICHLRPKLPPYGWKIPLLPSHGAVGYRLTRLTDEETAA